MDSDDELADGALKKMLNNTDRNRMVVGGIEKKFKNHVEKEIGACFEKAVDHNEMIIEYLLHNREMDVGLWNKMFLRSVLVEYSIKFENTNYFEDTLFILQYLENINLTDIAFVNDIVYIIHKRNGSTTRRFDPSLEIKELNYVESVNSIISDLSTRERQIVVGALSVRLKIFEIHQKFKFEKEYKIQQSSKSLKQLNVNLKVLSQLNRKYRMSYFGILLFPRMYRYLYVHLMR